VLQLSGKSWLSRFFVGFQNRWTTTPPLALSCSLRTRFSAKTYSRALLCSRFIRAARATRRTNHVSMTGVMPRSWPRGTDDQRRQIRRRGGEMRSIGFLSGRPGSLPSRGSHRSGRARLTHPAPRSTGSLYELASGGRYAEAEAGSVSEFAQTCPTGPVSAGLCGQATYATYVSSPARSC
jgi:hypothetical protein